MPEIGEVARIVHYLKKHAVGRTIAKVRTQVDDIVYTKQNCSHITFEKEVTGKAIVDAKQQGKYFWIELDHKIQPLMHFGMSGWMKFSNDDTAYYRPAQEKGIGGEEWPPKYWKFILELEGEPDCQIAFVDPRRLGRIRLIRTPGADIRKKEPLKDNGPDPLVDKGIFTEKWLGQKLKSKRVPVKALLLDQANISGIGNWVGDEILYQAKIHPEQYSNTLSEAQVEELYKSIMNVCGIAVNTLAESSKFPADWLMKYRWGKGKGNSKLPNGQKIEHIKVGGRTSAIVPSVQKKTGPVAGDVGGNNGKRKNDKGKEDEEEEDEDNESDKPKPKRTRVSKS
ncbi:MAG: hypothetical protein M1820_000617 [Bogoriella megaspora]|nr:MAG: hypothetical protein M1820_000617 [Bogoriella megaspora]